MHPQKNEMYAYEIKDEKATRAPLTALIASFLIIIYYFHRFYCK